MTDVPLVDYVDALNEERRKTDHMRALAMIGTIGALIFGIFRATGVLATEFKSRMDTTNEWRGALDDQSKGKATVQQFDQLKERVEGIEKKLDAMLNKVIGFGLLITFVVGLIAIVSSVIGK